MIEISRDEYLREVTNADPESFVVLHLYQNSNEFCTLINMHLPALAKQNGHVKQQYNLGKICENSLNQMHRKLS